MHIVAEFTRCNFEYGVNLTCPNQIFHCSPSTDLMDDHRVPAFLLHVFLTFHDRGSGRTVRRKSNQWVYLILGYLSDLRHINNCRCSIGDGLPRNPVDPLFSDGVNDIYIFISQPWPNVAGSSGSQHDLRYTDGKGPHGYGDS